MPERPYLLEIADRLWPHASAAAASTIGTDSSVPGLTLRAVPDIASPSLLLPAGRAAAAGAVRAYGGHSSRLGRWRTRGAAAALTLGLGGLLFRDRVTVGGAAGGVTDELTGILGRRVQVAVRVGPARANRKPVLAVLTGDGELVAFAKVGSSPLTRRLIDDEADALQRMSGLVSRTVRIPRLLHHGPWGDMNLLVQEALPIQRSRRVPAGLLGHAMAEVADALDGGPAPWGRSPHAGRVRQALAEMRPSAAAEQLVRAVDALTMEPTELPLGCWHGDWTPWNCAAVADSVLVWDWERFGSGVPVGFDALHYRLQVALAARGPSADLPQALLASAQTHLAPIGLNSRQSGLTALAYLIEIATRYLGDDQAAAGARVGQIDSWLLPVINQAVAGQLSSVRGERSE